VREHPAQRRLAGGLLPRSDLCTCCCRNVRTCAMKLALNVSATAPVCGSRVPCTETAVCQNVSSCCCVTVWVLSGNTS
jgi:hypothetical protein